MANRETKRWQYFRENQALHEAGAPAKKPAKPKPERVRCKDWAESYTAEPDGYDDLDLADHERVVPKGETEARRVRLPPSPLHAGLGATPPSPAPAAANRESALPKTAHGTVVEVSSGLCRVALADRTLLCDLRSALRTAHSGFSNLVAAGDEVVVTHNGHGRGMVEAVLPRRSALARPDVFYSHLQQVIVANVDQVLIIAAWREPAFWPELVDRYLIAALLHNLAPTICINKTDLAEDPAELRGVLDAYAAAGHPVLCTSARTGAGLDALRSLLAGRTTALAGLSGVGKSSLLSAVEPGLNLRTSAVSERRHEGRHTTTQVTLHRLKVGGFVADTPGIREFGLSGLRQNDLPRFYPEISAQAGACAYANCTHTREPGCAVKQAVRAGQLAAMRYDNYRKILADLKG